MQKILQWIKSHCKSNTYIKPQKLVELKRTATSIEFIYPGHPLYDNILDAEKNHLRLLAPNEAAYDETSLIHNFAAIVTYNENTYLVVNSFKHFKEQSFVGLLQFDENIYEVIPFTEDEQQYKTSNRWSFNETYEYDHPIENYAFTAEYQNKLTKFTIERGKKPLTIAMIDSNRPLFTEKLSTEQIEMIDYTIIPTLNAYNELSKKNMPA